MLSKKQRLKTKDVLFLTKKRQYFGRDLFGFFYIKQYPNLTYHQISCHISIKYNKRATARNTLKRAIMTRLQEKGHLESEIKGAYYKIFVILNKNKLDLLQKDVANQDRKHIVLLIQKYFEQSFTALSHHLGSSSKTSSTTAINLLKHSAEKTNKN